MSRAWFHFAGKAGGFAQDALERALRDAGIELRPLDLDAPSGPGVVVFDEIDDRLHELIRAASENGLDRVVAVATGHAPLRERESWGLLAAGAADVFSWHHSETAAAEVAARIARWEEVEKIVRSPAVSEHLIGESAVWRSVVRRLVEVARFTDAPLLITGETGTGKELVARLVHELDARERKRELVLLDCTTIVPTLSGSEFFGHERGAFTGAVAARDGAFGLAHGGTLFLDEVGELPLGLQAELLRVVQEGTYKRVGSNDWREAHFRLICATNRDLLEHATKETFRWDFYYRIAGWSLRLPNLRERTEDIVPLVRHFLRQLTPPHEALPELDPLVRDFLVSREYPGNARDLRHLVTRIKFRHVGPGPITLGDVPEEERVHAERAGDWRDERFDASIRLALASGVTLRQLGSAAADAAIRIAIADEEGNVQRAAARLGVTPRALQLRRAARRRVGAGDGASGDDASPDGR